MFLQFHPKQARNEIILLAKKSKNPVNIWRSVPFLGGLFNDYRRLLSECIYIFKEKSTRYTGNIICGIQMELFSVLRNTYRHSKSRVNKTYSQLDFIKKQHTFCCWLFKHIYSFLFRWRENRWPSYLKIFVQNFLFI